MKQCATAPPTTMPNDWMHVEKKIQREKNFSIILFYLFLYFEINSLNIVMRMLLKNYYVSVYK